MSRRNPLLPAPSAETNAGRRCPDAGSCVGMEVDGYSRRGLPQGRLIGV